VRQALCSLDLHHLEDRLITSLSGGERERVAIATILVQNPAIWLLDEPTNHLDPHHQLIVLDLLKQLTQEQRIVVTTVHNPALAMRYADQVLLLYGEGQWEFGPAKDLLEPSRLERIYQTPFEYFQNKAGDRTVLLPA
jgi:iron complex transport system ATP-binding protein